MKSINRVFLVGLLGSTPEVHHTATGKPYCRLSLATTHSFKRGDEWVEDTDWHTVVCWDHQAMYVSQYLGKGDACAIEGRLSTHSYDDAQGVRHKVVEVVAEHVTILPCAAGKYHVKPPVPMDPSSEPPEV